jgi:signal transduction histidine kinase
MTARLQETVRVREQAERELVASRDAALAAAHAKAEFVTNVSHEFRTPMTEILGAAEILTQRDGLDDGVRLEFAGIALRGAQRLAELIDDVLEFGAKDEWPMAQVDLAATLHEALGRLPGPKQQRVSLHLDDPLPPVRGDAGRLTDVWGRLLDNAAKFSDAGQPIDLRALRRGNEVVVEVADRGVGVSRVDLARIFEPFCQVGRDQLTDKAHGTGLGLSLAKKTVERHGGRIEVESELGNGATFRVVLPAMVAAPSPRSPTPVGVGG